MYIRTGIQSFAMFVLSVFDSWLLLVRILICLQLVYLLQTYFAFLGIVCNLFMCGLVLDYFFSYFVDVIVEMHMCTKTIEEAFKKKVNILVFYLSFVFVAVQTQIPLFVVSILLVLVCIGGYTLDLPKIDVSSCQNSSYVLMRTSKV